MYCKNCGNKLPDVGDFCVNCGSRTLPLAMNPQIARGGFWKGFKDGFNENFLEAMKNPILKETLKGAGVMLFFFIILYLNHFS